MGSDADSAATGLAPAALPWAAALIALIMAAPTIEHRLELRGFSVAVMEPIGLACAAGLWWQGRRAPGGWRARVAAAFADPLTRFVLAMGAGLLLWIAATSLGQIIIGRPAGGGWRARLSDLRNWAVPILIFSVMLLAVHQRWRDWTTLFVPIGVAHAALGIYQWATNSFRPFATANAFYKAALTVDPGTNRPRLASFGIGLFSHPNALGLYLALALMIGLGWRQGRRRSLLAAVVVGCIVAGLATTYAKAAIGAAAIGAIVMAAHQRIRSSHARAMAGGAALMGAGVMVWLAASALPRAWRGTLIWRIKLWDAALGLAGSQPSVLAVGGGMEDYGRIAIYGQPHNQLLHLLLSYGLPAVIWLGALAWRLHSAASSMRQAGAMDREPLLASLWLGLWVFLAASMLEAPLVSIEWRMTFLLLIACFVGLRREILRPPHAAS